MAWNFNSLKYGWMILASITLGTTIYVANNTRERVRPEDIVELELGTYERCLTTQYASNSYYVIPPEFVRTWYSNSYEQVAVTNVRGVTTNISTNWVAVLHANILTNVFGVRIDREMLAELDDTIKALVPYYCDPATVYEGMSNVTMLTVTGLFASLCVGDHTNQFTAIPAWAGTNGVTNAATYGALPLRISKQHLEERYKVLQALRYVKRDIIWDPTNILAYSYGESKAGCTPEDFNLVKSACAATWSGRTGGGHLDGPYAETALFYYFPSYGGIFALGHASKFSAVPNVFAGSVPHIVTLWMRGQKPLILNDDNQTCTSIYDANDSQIIESSGFVVQTVSEEETNTVWTGSCIGTSTFPNWCPDPEANYEENSYRSYFQGYYSDGFGMVDYHFQYCTNKYW